MLCDCPIVADKQEATLFRAVHGQACMVTANRFAWSYHVFAVMQHWVIEQRLLRKVSAADGHSEEYSPIPLWQMHTHSTTSFVCPQITCCMDLTAEKSAQYCMHANQARLHRH